jgi:uncharacterized protein YjcR
MGKAKYDQKLIGELYLEGKVDQEIADKVGCSVANIKYWRDKRGLPPNGVVKFQDLMKIPRDGESIFSNKQFLDKFFRKPVRCGRVRKRINVVKK